jgi:hypothetical protein
MSATAASFAAINIINMSILFLSMLVLSCRHEVIPVDTIHSVKTWEVVINEIMADPDPAAGNVNYPEYVELYNKKDVPVSLKNWKFCVGATCKSLPDLKVPADSFLVLTATASIALFPAEVNVGGISAFPALSNTGQTLQLLNDAGNIVSAITYTNEWYQDMNKKDGGYSLEQIDPNNPCAEGLNWRASISSSGGSPGKKNTIFAANPDVQPPEILRVNVFAPDRLEIDFTESLDSITLLDKLSYEVSTIGNPVKIDLSRPGFKSVLITLGTSIKESVVYTITIGSQLTDCAGNALKKSSTARFALPVAALPKDIAINEILFDPKAGGVDFVELVNCSEEVLDLKTMLLCHYDTINHVFSAMEPITTSGYLFFPGEYLLLSENSELVKKQYFTSNPAAFLTIPNLPPLNADEGTICLKTATDIIDNVTYLENMHFSLLKDTKGISLERVNYRRPASDVTNWHSAASSVAGATPGYKNSQYMEELSTEEPVKVDPEIFSPNDDGLNDLLAVHYHFNEPAMHLNVLIYDSKGRLVKTLVNNELIGPEGTYSWDGINDGKEKERIGIYIIYAEAINLSGSVKRYKKVCVLAGKN